MCKILLSINPEYVEKILNGNKKYEYRKVKCRQEVDKIIIYSTYPIKKVVGEATVDKILEDSPTRIWETTNKESGINIDFFEKYFKGRKTAVAYKLSNIKIYDKPKEIESYGLKVAPQSFVYV